MKMRHIIVSLLFVLSGVATWAQSNIQFETVEHNFGIIERGNPTEFTFRFTNMSNAPIKLKSVKASCGCTTPKWSQDPIAPNAVGEIQVKYNAASLGTFHKSVTVVYDSTREPVVLYVSGEVKEPLPPDPQYDYKYPQGNLSFDIINQDFGNMATDAKEPRMIEFHVKNIGPHKVTFTDEYRAAKMFKIKPQHYELLPGEKTTVRVTLTPSLATHFDNFSEEIYLKSDDKEQPEKKLTVVGNIVKVWTPEELSNAANIEFQSADYKGGQVIEGEKLEIKFTFRNTGKSPLEIYSAKPSCGCTASAPKEKTIAPGATSEIVATFDSRGRVGTQHKSVTVNSNDPDQPNITLTFQCEVIQDPFHTGSTTNPQTTSPLFNSGN